MLKAATEVRSSIFSEQYTFKNVLLYERVRSPKVNEQVILKAVTEFPAIP